MYNSGFGKNDKPSLYGYPPKTHIHYNNLEMRNKSGKKKAEIK